jgi:hypothetical protein
LFVRACSCIVVAVSGELEPSPRRRGVRLLLLAVLLLGAALGLLALLRPDQGAYPAWMQVSVHLLWVLACMCLGFGGFHAVVGALGGGVLRTLIGFAFGVATLGALGIGGFVLHAAMSYDGSRSQSSSSSSWDWD